MELTAGRRVFLWTLIVSLCVTGAVAVGTLLFAEFDDTAARILATTALLSLASLLSLPAGVLLDQRRTVLLAWWTIAAVAAGFVLAMIAIWGEPGEEWVEKFTITLWLAAGAGAQAAAVTSRLRPGDSRRLRALHALSVLLTASLAVLIAVAVWTDPDSDAFVRATGAVAVAAVLASILQPILRRVETPAPSRARLVLELDREPSPEAVTAAVEALARHGVVAQVVGRPKV